MSNLRDVLRHPLAAILVALAVAACEGGVTLETRTFEVEHLEPEDALMMVEPYVFGDRVGRSGEASYFEGGITVRETRDNLEKIERVLERFDRPKPGIQLRFQLIEADGADVSDTLIADVVPALRELFRFQGYRLLADAYVGALEGGGSTQVLREGEREYVIAVQVIGVRETPSGGSADLSVELMTSDFGRAISTQMSVPAGKTVVLGSARPDPDEPTIILTVRPEFVTAELNEGG